jgi:hypothetical protein
MDSQFDIGQAGSNREIEINPNPDAQTLLWSDQPRAKEKMDMILGLAGIKGYCYTLSLFYVCDLARLSYLDFCDVVGEFQRSLKAVPDGKDLISAIVEVFLKVNGLVGGLCDFESCTSDQEKMERIMSRIDRCTIRMGVQNARTQVMHMEEPIGGWCDCTSIICEHGWSFRMFRAACMVGGRKVGASGYCFENFGFDTGEEEQANEDDVNDDAYSMVDPVPAKLKVTPAVETWRSSGEASRSSASSSPMMVPARGASTPVKMRSASDPRQGSHKPAPLEDLVEDVKLDYKRPGGYRRSLPRVASETEEIREGMSDMLSLLHRLLAEGETTSNRLARLEMSKEEIVVKTPVTPPASPEDQRAHGIVKSEVCWDDSSSQVGRYSKRYMEPGTVFTVGKPGTFADEKEGRTVLEVENFLVDGFSKPSRLIKLEAEAVRKLKPIVGLPKPYANSRLNFLANIYTAMDRALKRTDNGYLGAMLKAMSGPTVLPSDNLLCQVLNSTMDRDEGIFCGNPFKLPYLEIGMALTEDAVIKVFTLLIEEFKLLWFQEHKNITVPDFHNMFDRLGDDIVTERRVKRGKDSRRKDQVVEQKAETKRSRSLIGFL